MLSLCFSRVFLVLFSSRGEERVGMLPMRLFVYLACVSFCLFFSSSCCQGRAAACDCDVHCTFPFTIAL